MSDIFYRLRYWTFWVCVNATASFGWGLVLEHGAAYVLGMLAGIAIFIVAYASLDAYLLKHGYQKWHDALKLGVYIKAGLQLLNLGILVGVPLISIEFWAGFLVVTLLEKSGLSIYSGGVDNPFWFALISTLLTGALLSIIVGMITGLIKLFRNQRQAKKLNAQQD